MLDNVFRISTTKWSARKLTYPSVRLSDRCRVAKVEVEARGTALSRNTMSVYHVGVANLSLIDDVARRRIYAIKYVNGIF